MQSRDIRTAILTLQKQGRGLNAIARAVNVSRNTVRRVLASGSADVPEIERVEKAAPHESAIRELYTRCEGNLVRVHEELATQGVVLPYSTLSGFCRRHGIGQKPKERAGSYDFKPGEEMQHDTSPHDVVLGGMRRRLHCASLVLCYSRMIFSQVYPVWNRFWAKVFLSDAMVAFDGAAERCMVDNASILVARGTGKNAVFAPEVVAFGERFGTTFVAHELGDTNRSARVERPFYHIERNYYPGRTFVDVADVNAQLRIWCDKVNATPKRSLQTSPLMLFATERTALRRLPEYIPPVYLLHRRSVDVEGYIKVHTNRYSVPTEFIDSELTVHETKDQIRIFDGHRLVCEHNRQENGLQKRLTLPEHERKRRDSNAVTSRMQNPEEHLLRADSHVMAAMVDALLKRHGNRTTRLITRLHRLWLDYPAEPLRTALGIALEYGLLDLERIESLVLRHVAGDYFKLPLGEDQPMDIQDKRNGDKT